MNCLKCGREAAEAKSFCNGCQAVMQTYPVKPGISIHLPHRETPAPEKKSPARRQEDYVAQLKTLIRWLTAAIALLSILLCACAGMLLQTLAENKDLQNIGRNYTTYQTDQTP